MSTNDGQPRKATRLLAYLPAIYADDDFLGRFLLAFEDVLLGSGLEGTVASLSRYFDPHDTPPEFLPWLAGWTGFALRADLPEKTPESFIARAIQLYRLRGTKKGMQQLLEIFTGRSSASVAIRDDLAGKPFHFIVGLSFGEDQVADIKRTYAIAYALIDRERPAHTSYELEVYVPAMKIGSCRVGNFTGPPETTTFLSTAKPL